jgi:hypothetical protein
MLIESCALVCSLRVVHFAQRCALFVGFCLLLVFMQDRGVNAIIAGFRFKSACGLQVPLDFDPVGL